MSKTWREIAGLRLEEIDTHPGHLYSVCPSCGALVDGEIEYDTIHVYHFNGKVWHCDLRAVGYEGDGAPQRILFSCPHCNAGWSVE